MPASGRARLQLSSMMALLCAAVSVPRARLRCCTGSERGGAVPALARGLGRRRSRVSAADAGGTRRTPRRSARERSLRPSW